MHNQVGGRFNGVRLHIVKRPGGPHVLQNVENTSARRVDTDIHQAQSAVGDKQSRDDEKRRRGNVGGNNKRAAIRPA